MEFLGFLLMLPLLCLLICAVVAAFCMVCIGITTALEKWPYRTSAIIVTFSIVLFIVGQNLERVRRAGWTMEAGPVPSALEDY